MTRLYNKALKTKQEKRRDKQTTIFLGVRIGQASLLVEVIHLKGKERSSYR
jgi:hypothetical protein